MITKSVKRKKQYITKINIISNKEKIRNREKKIKRKGERKASIDS